MVIILYKVLQDAKFIYKRHGMGSWEIKQKSYKTDSNGNLKVNGLTQGTYRFVETQAPAGYILDTTDTAKKYEFEVVWNQQSQSLEYVYNGVTSSSLNIIALNEKPTIEKVADKLTAGLGEKVRWEITTTVPSIINKMKTFTITDTLSEGLEFNTPINLEVVQGENLDDSDIELDVIELNDFEAINTFNFEENPNAIYVWGVVGNQLMIRFNPLNLTPSEDIVVSYDTKITSDAVIFPSGNDNEATLEYSISTSPNSTTETIRDEDIVYSFGLQINKTASNKTTMLAGAKFTLCKNEQQNVMREFQELMEL